PGSYTSFQSMMRTGTGRRGWSSRSVVLRKPLGSATGHLQDAGPDDVAVRVESLLGRLLAGLQHRGVVARQDTDEVRDLGVEIVQESGGELGVRLGDVLC